jgi:UDP-N-acetylmuramoyl-tripeptide--D-alanyl-D-alanine ligase
MNLSEDIKRVLYGKSESFDTSSRLLESDPFLQIEWNKHLNGVKIETSLVGGYNLENVTAAICVGSYFNVPEEKIIKSIEAYIPANNRSQNVTTASNLVILDAYNANPSSMQAALQNFAKLKAVNKMLILGDMLELGQESYVEHKAIVKLVNEFGFKDTILVGPEFQKVSGPGMIAFPNAAAAAEWLKKNPVSHFTILVKGSRGIRMEKVMDSL